MSYEYLRKEDPEVYVPFMRELERQRSHLEMIASENFTSLAVMEAMGSHLTNKYAEGYPGHRYYGGCECVDEIENIAIERAKKLFGAKFANVQPHSGSQANMAVYAAVLQPGDTIMGMSLNHGGHLTHGSPASISGRYYNSVSYNLNQDTEQLDYDMIRDQARKEKPKLIICGASAYPRTIDFQEMRKVADEVGAYLMADIAHIGGLVVTGCHPDPVPYCDIVTCTTHKTLRGPRGAVIVTNDEELAKKINSGVFPRTQGGPLEHVIAAKAVCFREDMKPEFKLYAQQIVKNASALAKTLTEGGLRLVTGGTDNHLILIDVQSMGRTGLEAQNLLDAANITANKNAIPYDRLKPSVTSGLRLGTPAVTTRGLKEEDMVQIGKIIVELLKKGETAVSECKKQVLDICERFPLYPELQ
jgi:glycine hydroxymethyltransferase